ncbi:unnamed protein product [Caenorhabditis brenneri]
MLVFLVCGCMVASIVIVFENRFYRVCSVRIKRHWRKVRIKWISLHYIIVIGMLIPFYFLAPDQETAVQRIFRTFPCLPRYIYEAPMYVLTENYLYHLTVIVAYLAIAGVEVFTIIGYVGYNTLEQMKSRTLSDKTFQMQKTFFIALVVQISIPLILAVAPVVSWFILILGFWYHQWITNLGVIMFTTHGAVSTIAMLIAHRPYREAIRTMIRKRRAASVENSRRAMYRNAVSDSLPCLPHYVYDAPVCVLAETYVYYLVIINIFMTICTLEVILMVSFMSYTIVQQLKGHRLSRKTYEMQKNFISALLLQVSIPLMTIVLPMVPWLYLVVESVYMQWIVNIGVVFMASHGCLATIVMMIAHRPYREAIIFMIRKKTIVSVDNSIMVMTLAPFVPWFVVIVGVRYCLWITNLGVIMFATYGEVATIAHRPYREAIFTLSSSLVYDAPVCVLAETYVYYLVIINIFMTICTLEVILMVSFMSYTIVQQLKGHRLSRKTYEMQKNFISALLLQVSIPLMTIVLPMVPWLYLVVESVYMQWIVNIGVVFMASHGCLATIVMMIAHRPYREAIMFMIRKKTIVSVDNSIMVMSAARN